MRLYRVMVKGEKLLKSNERAFAENVKINYLDEVYSHIVKTYKIDYAKNRRIIFSFTDDINEAIKILETNREYYDSIGYVDIDRFGCLKDNVYFAYPVFDCEYWLDLAFLSNVDLKDPIIQCVNYKCPPIRMISALIPSQNGALSWARNAKEYALICNDLRPTIIDDEEIEEVKKKVNEISILDKFIEKNDKDYFIETIDCNQFILTSNEDALDFKDKLINSLEIELANLAISESRRIFMTEEFNHNKSNYKNLTR